MKLSPGTQGTISELRVAIYLISLGWDVHRSLSPNGSTDLVAICGRKILRVQVKSTLSLSQSKNLRAGRNHLLAIVVGGELHFRAISNQNRRADTGLYVGTEAATVAPAQAPHG